MEEVNIIKKEIDNGNNFFKSANPEVFCIAVISYIEDPDGDGYDCVKAIRVAQNLDEEGCHILRNKYPVKYLLPRNFEPITKEEFLVIMAEAYSSNMDIANSI